MERFCFWSTEASLKHCDTLPEMESKCQGPCDMPSIFSAQKISWLLAVCLVSGRIHPAGVVGCASRAFPSGDRLTDWKSERRDHFAVDKSRFRKTPRRFVSRRKRRRSCEPELFLSRALKVRGLKRLRPWDVAKCSRFSSWWFASSHCAKHSLELVATIPLPFPGVWQANSVGSREATRVKDTSILLVKWIRDCCETISFSLWNSKIQ